MVKELILDWSKDTIIEAGKAYRNMPIDVYHKHPALSNSGIKLLLDCPARYFYQYFSGEYTEEENPSFKIGKASHCYILEGEKAFTEIYWHNPYAEFTKADNITFLMARGYDQKELNKMKAPDVKALMLENLGIEPKQIELSKNELNQVISLARAIKSNELAHNAFKQQGESEVSLFWEDKETGAMLKCRPDWLPYNLENVPDYKTTTSVEPNAFAKAFIKYGYYIQTALYRQGIKAVFDVDVENFFFVAQEKKAPCLTQVFLPDNNLLTYGEKHVKTGIHKFMECKRTGIWNGYSDSVIELSLEIKPEDLPNNYDSENSVVYLPIWVDSELSKYEEIA